MALRLGGQSCLREAVSQPQALGAAAQQSRAFHTTPAPQINVERRKMRLFMMKHGKELRHSVQRGPNYLGLIKNQPFPQNPQFKSQSVLSEKVRESIWTKIMIKGQSIKAVSAEFGVDMRRVAAVVRLKEVEKDWVAKGKKLALPYAKAVLDMLPQTRWDTGGHPQLHEPINEVHVHSYTMQQLFLPTSESRHFDREQAATAFHRHMKPADERVPHPELIRMEKRILDGEGRGESFKQFKKEAEESEKKAAEMEMNRLNREEKMTTRVSSNRFEYRFKDMSVDDVGRRGRSLKGVGWRYGVPFYDRKKGEVKIPTKVE